MNLESRLLPTPLSKVPRFVTGFLFNPFSESLS